MDNHSARSAGLAVSALFSLALGISACGSSTTSPPANDTALVKQAWTNFFAGSTSAADKIKLLQNGDQFSQVINEAVGLSISKTSSATVSSVVINNPTTATVTYSS